MRSQEGLNVPELSKCFKNVFLCFTNKEADDDDNGALSEVTSRASSNDVSGDWTYEWSLVRSLSPEWELNICDTDKQSR